MTTKPVVVKVGTSSVTTAEGSVDHEVLRAIAQQIATVRSRGRDVIVVTSGAITAGWAEVGGGRPRPHDSAQLQAVSAVGQPLLMATWREAFAEVGVVVGQVLLSPHDFADRRQYLAARRTIEHLCALSVVPIINENDAVADEEIRFGDNDRLAALVANVVGAAEVILLTDTDGLFTADPRLDPRATLIEEIRRVDEYMAMAGSSRSAVGSGGMASKMSAAKMASWSGVTAIIAAARRPRVIVDVLDAVPGSGTVVHARPERLSARESWIAFAAPSRGRLVINEGAVAAIRRRASLLSVGIMSHDGEWSDGDALDIADESGRVVAKGLARASFIDNDATDPIVIRADDLVTFPVGDSPVRLD